MRRRHLRRIGAAAAVAGLALALLPAASASAVAVPDWPTSRVPSGCPISAFAGAGAGYTVTYDDGIAPTIGGWSYNNSTSRVVMKPGANPTVFRVRATQTCGGVLLVVPLIRASINGGPVSDPAGETIEPFTSNAFTSVFGAAGSATAGTTGWVEVPFFAVAPRYDEFTLDQDFALVSKTDYTGSLVFTTGPWSKQRVYIVLASTQTTSASKSVVTKGGSVTFSTAVKVAGPAAYQAAAGVSVKFQTRLPGKSWVTRATRTTTSTGRASYSFKPSATTSWRWVLAENITTTPYWAGSSSAPKSIRVT